MDWTATVFIGLAAGFVATLLTPGCGPRAAVLNAALGIAGSVAATAFGRFAGLYNAGQSAGFISAVIGAWVALLGHRLVAKP